MTVKFLPYDIAIILHRYTYLFFQMSVDNNGVDISLEVDRIRRELESKAQAELNQKVQQVNLYLEEQKNARERIDRLRDNNEMQIRKEFEKVRRELLVSCPC